MAAVYESHKRVICVPMTRQEYNDYRAEIQLDWVMPADEDGDDAGYLVEDLDGGEPNHPDHKGYISWTPKAKFDNGYTKVEVKNKVEFEFIKGLSSSLEFKFERVGETTVTGCWAFLPNGFQVGYGESACVDPANYNQALGEKYAKERCIQASENKLWELEGYLLMTTGKTSDSFGE